MKINTLSLVNSNKYYRAKSINSVVLNVKERNNRNFDTNNYSGFYYPFQISFGAKSRISADDLISKIGEENFPSPKIVKELKSLGNSKEYSLYDIHKKYYEKLLSCMTLDEAKQKYPEFKDVIDAKDIDCKSQSPLSTIHKIWNKKIQGIDIKDLSLDLLKKQYAELISTENKDAYYNVTGRSVISLLDSLNIKRMNRKYIGFLFGSSSEIKQHLSDGAKKRWIKGGKPMRESASERMKKLSKDVDFIKKHFEGSTSESARKNKSEGQKNYWANDVDGSKRKEKSQKYKELENTERMQAIREAQRQAWKNFPKITQDMKDIAKLYRGIHIIIDKIKRGIKLTEVEQKFYNAYYRECKEKNPGYEKMIGQEFHNILVERGIIKDNSDKK